MHSRTKATKFCYITNLFLAVSLNRLSFYFAKKTLDYREFAEMRQYVRVLKFIDKEKLPTRYGAENPDWPVEFACQSLSELM